MCYFFYARFNLSPSLVIYSGVRIQQYYCPPCAQTERIPGVLQCPSAVEMQAMWFQFDKYIFIIPLCLSCTTGRCVAGGGLSRFDIHGLSVDGVWVSTAPRAARYAHTQSQTSSTARVHV